MTRLSPSAASFVASAISLPIWVIIVCKCIVAFADDFNPAGVLVWPVASLMMAMPSGWIIGFFVSPAIYKGCSLCGPWRYGRTVFVHASMSVTIVVLYLLGGVHPLIALVAGISVVFGPMLVIPSLVGTLVYASATSPTMQDAAA